MAHPNGNTHSHRNLTIANAELLLTNALHRAAVKFIHSSHSFRIRTHKRIDVAIRVVLLKMLVRCSF